MARQSTDTRIVTYDKKIQADQKNITHREL